jgi:hypothetical protein
MSGVPTKSQERLIPRSAIVENTAHPITWLNLDRIDVNESKGATSDSHKPGGYYGGGVATKIREMDSPVTPSSQDTITYRDNPMLNRNDGAGDRPPRNLVMDRTPTTPPVFKTYKRRWFGLLQLVLLNIVVSMDVSNTRWSFDWY